MNTPNAPSKIYFISHGETTWSLSGHHTGSTDLPLSLKGGHEARELRERLRHLTFDHVFTSPRHRARQTCVLSGWAACARIDPDLAEWDHGDYEGRLTTEIHAESPGWDIFTDGCPAGESPGQITARADRLIARLRAHAGRTALFSHGHFGRVFGVRWLGLPLAAARHFSLGTASVSVLGQGARPTDPPMVMQWNVLPAYISPVA